VKKIIAENLECIYFTKADGLPSEQSFDRPVWGLPDPQLWENVLSKSMHDMRWVLINLLPHSPDTPLGLYLMHWDVPVDLENLDLKVENNTYSDEDFDKAILTQWTTVFCDKRDWSGLSLHAPSDAPYKSDVYARKVKERYARDGFIKYCPSCGTKFRISIAKIF
jgi:hypothetical protein